MEEVVEKMYGTDSKVKELCKGSYGKFPTRINPKDTIAHSITNAQIY